MVAALGVLANTNLSLSDPVSHRRLLLARSDVVARARRTVLSRRRPARAYFDDAPPALRLARIAHRLSGAAPVFLFRLAAFALGHSAHARASGFVCRGHPRSNRMEDTRGPRMAQRAQIFIKL